MFFSGYIVNDNNFSLSVLWGGGEKIADTKDQLQKIHFLKSFKTFKCMKNHRGVFEKQNKLTTNQD